MLLMHQTDRLRCHHESDSHPEHEKKGQNLEHCLRHYFDILVTTLPKMNESNIFAKFISLIGFLLIKLIMLC